MLVHARLHDDDFAGGLGRLRAAEGIEARDGALVRRRAPDGGAPPLALPVRDEVHVRAEGVGTNGLDGVELRQPTRL